MIIKSMDASFGGLENAHMELEPGLNIIEAPNEAGKSTWCGFIRTMLYGINTSQREKSGVLPDKKRFLPWGSYPMTGAMDISWRGGDVTLLRKGSAGKPMGACEAKLSGTGEKVPELSGKAPGEIILGVPESVFRRSAFISSGAMAVDKDAELEKRISALISSGSEEDEAYSTAHKRLHDWRVKRKHNARVGRAAELEAAIKEKSSALDSMKAENERLGGLYAEREDIKNITAALEEELRRHEAARLRAEREKVRAARAARTQAAEELERIKAAAAGITAEGVSAARAAVSAYKEAAAARRAGEEAVGRYNEARAALEAAERKQQAAALAAGGVSEAGIESAKKALMEYESARAASRKAEEELAACAPEVKLELPLPKLLPVLAVVLLVLGAACCVLYFALSGSYLMLVSAAAAFVVAAVLLSVYFSKKRGIDAIRDEANARRIVYENMASEAAGRLGAAEAALVAALADIGGETIPARAAGRIEEREALLEALEQAENEASAARQVERSLSSGLAAAAAAAEQEAAAAAVLYEALTAIGIDPAAMNIPALIDEKAELLAALAAASAAYDAALRLAESVGEAADDGGECEPAAEPTMEREEAAAKLELARARAAELERLLALSEGELRHLGDPLVVATELNGLREQLAENEEEYEALSLAMSVLDEANTELQQRFSPIVGTKAGELMAAMTGGAYDRISFDREFNFTAARENEAERSADYLSTGTSAQLYLAVRLAICQLALSENESCPVILDDALLGFDDKRAKAALRLLKELSKERQIILFTCQSREKRFLEEI